MVRVEHDVREAIEGHQPMVRLQRHPVDAALERRRPRQRIHRALQPHGQLAVRIAARLVVQEQPRLGVGR